MNKVLSNISVIILLCSSSLFSSCDEGLVVIPDGPTITVKSPGIDNLESYKSNAEGHLHFSASIIAPGGFDNVIVNIVSNDTAFVAFSDTSYVNTTEYNVPELILYFNNRYIDKNLSIVIEATDKNDLKSSAFVSITVVSADLLVYNHFDLEASLADGSASTFMSTSHGIINSAYGINNFIPNFAEDTDLGYYHGANSGASIASPLAFSNMSSETDATNNELQALVKGWSKWNKTTFKNTSLTEERFDDLLSVVEIENVYTNGFDPSDLKTGLNVGDVVAFETDSTKYGGSKRGVFLVNAITDGDNDGNFDGKNDAITLSMMVVR
ncbi:MAG: hypothetical protein OEW67_13135 [Cyclobacteriaceae bacterium]|nr:hypothetical protein [Cyclobacteriaceae bacterium]